MSCLKGILLYIGESGKLEIARVQPARTVEQAKPTANLLSRGLSSLRPQQDSEGGRGGCGVCWELGVRP